MKTTLEPPTHRKVRRCRIPFSTWCKQKGIPTASESELATIIGDALCQPNRGRASKPRRVGAAAKRQEAFMVAQREHQADPEAWEMVETPLDLTRESDRAYARAHQRRAARRERDFISEKG